ncbi:MAG: MarR family winged helix-turn-helix transcriptional regulator [Thermoplasmatota archaeon]
MAESAARRAAALALDTGLQLLCFLRAEARLRKPGDLSMPQFRFLHMLRTKPEDSLSAIAEDLGVSPPALSRMVDGLVERGLVERTTASGDRRRVELALTPAGDALMREVRAGIVEGLAQRLAGPEQNLKALVEAMGQLQASLLQAVA